ncbi:putative tmem1 family protein [Golovinomyces cichoracearum]|uniref:Putative tmem1 family protein n=1 Tax=Golovinomyces cichoracearum TaxID=62708 RepID=A0A420HL30_9PEZI|nr:putative tmem1 family protein [Golovinomyces cichoracearum]
MEHLSSSSKVTVEYFDPFGVYRLLSPILLKQFPLRNLHWESHAGPLRSINLLHIDLIQSQETVSVPEVISTGTESHRSAKSEESASTGDEALRNRLSGHAPERPQSQPGPPRAPLKERRHQMPGLRQTPYLKILLLRCDDVDTYRSHRRPFIKQWIKKHTLPTQLTTKSSAQENYDAFEWLIIHVTIPNTPAANQPRTSKKNIEGSSGITKEKSGSRWRGGGSSTILEKLKSDFNGSSKSSLDHIAQIRLSIDDVPHEMVPRIIPTISKPYVETPQENENAWQDLISKLKSLILAAFDMRVSQYEEDIREKDSQRSLPGWNFCTFFVLKESLAIGYECVGLVEDSLIEYDELAVGLDTIIREQVENNRAEHGGSFLPFTDDLKDQAETAIANISKDIGISNFLNTGAPVELHSDSLNSQAYEIPLNVTKKRYRELILANNISIFDFRSYLFARQLHLLLRLANASSTKEELLSEVQEQFEPNPKSLATKKALSKASEQTENLTVLSKICRRAVEFITATARTMRADLWAAHHPHYRNRDSSECETSQTRMNQIILQVIENIVSSFIFSTAQQILAHTSTKYLSIPQSNVAHLPSLDKKDARFVGSDSTSNLHPARSSSLASRSQKQRPREHSNPPRARRASVPNHGFIAPSLKTGLEELSAHRAELYILSRSILQRAGAQRGWSVGWSEMAKYQAIGTEGFEDIDLTKDSTNNISNLSDQDTVPPSCHGILNRLLRSGLRSKDDFYNLYETLCDKALRHYTIAYRHHSVQSSLADLAVLKYHLKDYTSAASHLNRLMNFYEETGWSNIELSMLIIYAKCLQQLQRREEFVQVTIKLISKIAAAENDRWNRKSSVYWTKKMFYDDSIILQEQYLPELFEITRTLTIPTIIPIHSFFGFIEVDETIQYHQNKDSFELRIRLLYLLNNELSIKKAKVRLNSFTHDINREIWLEAEGTFKFKKGINEILVKSNTTIPGTFLMTSIVFSGNNVIHSHDSLGGNATSSIRHDSFIRCPKLLIYQRPEAFDIKLHPSRSMHLGKTKLLELELSSGWNNVTSGEIQIRAATAGLRLQTSEARVFLGEITILKSKEAGIVRIGSLKSYSCAIVAIPFSLEQDTNEISVKLDFIYTTEDGTFTYATTPSISISYPLGVNVQDFFKHKFLFSKFTISSANSGPLRLIDCKLDRSELFEAYDGHGMNTPFVIYPRQPATVLYKINKAKENEVAHDIRKKKDNKLALILKFRCLEDEVIATITSDLEKSLKDSPLNCYRRLVVGKVIREIRQHLSPQDIERVALLGEIPMSYLAKIAWWERFSGLGYRAEGEVSTLLLKFIEEWLQRRTTLPLDTTFNDEEKFPVSRSIVIPVEVPSVTVVITVDIQLLGLSSPNSEAARVAVNQSISASLNIKWTRKWDTKSSSERMDMSQDTYEFSYEIFGPSETWIIGGRRKSYFKIPKIFKSSPSSLAPTVSAATTVGASAGAGATDSYELSSKMMVDHVAIPIVLVPLRQGLLPYPTVEIKVVMPPTSRATTPKILAHNMNVFQDTFVNFEIDLKNTAEFIHIVSDTQKTTVSLDTLE